MSVVGHNSTGLIAYVLDRLDTIHSWDDHFIVLRSIREEINALNARDRARAMNRLAVRHKAIRKAAADSRPTIYPPGVAAHEPWRPKLSRSEEHTSELQSLMRISYAVFCL